MRLSNVAQGIENRPAERSSILISVSVCKLFSKIRFGDLLVEQRICTMLCGVLLGLAHVAVTGGRPGDNAVSVRNSWTIPFLTAARLMVRVRGFTKPLFLFRGSCGCHTCCGRLQRLWNCRPFDHNRLPPSRGSFESDTLSHLWVSGCQHWL
jgi:hypothetical protein